MTRLLLRLCINAFAIWAAASLVDGLSLSENLMDVLIVALVFGLINTFIKPLVQALSLPFLFLTLGLFTLVINALMLMLTDAFTQSLSVADFWAALWGSVVISIVSMLLSGFLGDEKKA